MIIKDVHKTTKNGSVFLTASCKIRKIGWDKIFFQVDASVGDYLYEDASPFAAALLLPAMKQREELTINGTVSKKLYYGMHRIMHIVSAWGIGLQPVRINADHLDDNAQLHGKTATFFSAGVDSFYTYLKHKQDPLESDRVQSLLYINNNFDVNPNNTWLSEQIKKRISDIANQEQLEPIFITSNVNSLNLLNPILSWDYIHGGCLAATGLALRNGFGRIYIPSTHANYQQIPWGSNLELDSNWSTDNLSFVYDGSEVTRVDKVRSELAKSQLALKHLRVCYMNEKNAYNCGRCDKCLRTMVNLYIAGALNQTQTFPHELNLDLIASTPTIRGKGLQIFHNENLEALREMRLNPDLQQALSTSIGMSLNQEPNKLGKIRDKIAYIDHQYSKSKLYLTYGSIHDKVFAGKRA